MQAWGINVLRSRAGAKPTATSVVSDLITIAKNIRLATTYYMFNSYQHKTQLTSSENVFGQYYFSLDVPDTRDNFAVDAIND